MKKVALFAGVLVSACSGGSSWSEVAKNDDFADYVNRSTSRKSGSIVRMTSMRDYAAEQSLEGHSYFSQVDENEYECREGRWRKLVLVVFPRHKAEGSGHYIVNQSPPEWSRVPSDGLERTLWTIACDR